jgi:hypothetical protein
VEFEKMVSSNSAYSGLFGELAKLVAQDAELAYLPFDDEASKISDFMSSFIYNVSPWPVIIDDKTVRKFGRVVDSVPPLLKKVIDQHIANDQRYFGDYVNISDIAVERFKKYLFNPEDIMCRYDAIVAAQKVKLVEINIGSSLGGWWSDWLYPEILSALKDVGQIKNWNLKYRRISENTFRAVWQSILRLKGASAQGNLYIFLPDTATENLEVVYNHINELVMAVKPAQYPDGKLVIFNDLDKIVWSADGILMYQDEVMDTLMLPVVKGDELPVSFMARLQSYSERNQFYYPDNDGLAMFANKLLFALLHEQKTRAFLTPAELALVDEHIPWSAKLNSETVFNDGQSQPTEAFVMANQQTLVFKKAQSMQGKDVLVGKSLTAQQWLAGYVEYQNDSDWLIQQYCEPDVVYSADPKLGMNGYRMVWGIFGFDGKYAGSWCRGVALQNQDTVINLARGASEFVVVEEQPHKQKFTL